MSLEPVKELSMDCCKAQNALTAAVSSLVIIVQVTYIFLCQHMDDFKKYLKIQYLISLGQRRKFH